MNRQYTVLREGDGRRLAVRVQLLLGLGTCIVIEAVNVEGDEVRRDVHGGSVILEEVEFRTLVEEFGPPLKENYDKEEKDALE